MANSYLHSRNFGLGDFEHTQKLAVFLATTVHLYIKVNSGEYWSRGQVKRKGCRMPSFTPLRPPPKD
jgi:hypothetical protein